MSCSHPVDTQWVSIWMNMVRVPYYQNRSQRPHSESGNCLSVRLLEFPMYYQIWTSTHVMYLLFVLDCTILKCYDFRDDLRKLHICVRCTSLTLSDGKMSYLQLTVSLQRIPRGILLCKGVVWVSLCAVDRNRRRLLPAISWILYQNIRKGRRLALALVHAQAYLSILLQLIHRELQWSYNGVCWQVSSSWQVFHTLVMKVAGGSQSGRYTENPEFTPIYF